MNRRSRVLRAASRLIVLLIVTRTVAPGLRSRAMSQSPVEKVRKYKQARRDCNSPLRRRQQPGRLRPHLAFAAAKLDRVVAEPAVDRAGGLAELVGDREVGGVA